MTDGTIFFEKANLPDLREIWYILHADSRMLKEEQLLEKINDLYVLRYQKRILGVLCGTYSAGKVDISWVVIHPLYPEKTLRQAMIREFSGVLCREPENNSANTGQIAIMKHWLKKQLSKTLLFTQSEGDMDGVQD